MLSVCLQFKHGQAIMQYNYAHLKKKNLKESRTNNSFAKIFHIYKVKCV